MRSEQETADLVLKILYDAKRSMTEVDLEACLHLHDQAEMLNGIKDNIIAGDFEAQKKGDEFSYKLTAKGRQRVKEMGMT